MKMKLNALEVYTTLIVLTAKILNDLVLKKSKNVILKLFGSELWPFLHNLAITASLIRYKKERGL